MIRTCVFMPVKKVFSFLKANPVTYMLACCVKHIVKVAAAKQIKRIITAHLACLAITTIAPPELLR